MRHRITGGAGFIGSNFVRNLLASDRSAEVTNLDLLTYNIASGAAVPNRTVGATLIELIGDGSIELVTDRPGQDRRYALDTAKIAALGWQPAISLQQGLEETLAWYQQRPEWWTSLCGS